MEFVLGVIMKNLAIFLALWFFNVPASASTLGERAYYNTCAQCHGVQGQGDGPVGLALQPNPPNFKVIFTHKNITEIQTRIWNILNSKTSNGMHESNLSSSDKKEIINFLVEKFKD